MAETNFTSLLPSQKASSTLPYEAIWRAVYDLTPDDQKEYFARSNVLQQTREIMKRLQSNEGMSVIEEAIRNTIQPASSGLSPYVNASSVKKLSTLTEQDKLKLINNAVSSLSNRAKDLSSMSAKALEAQKLKETSGMGHMTDEEFRAYQLDSQIPDRIFSGKPAGIPKLELSAQRNVGTPYSAAGRFFDESELNKDLMNVKGNEADTSTANQYLRNKQEYNEPYNKNLRRADKLLSFIPIVPFASQAAIARQQGEISPTETGLTNPRVMAGGALNALAIPTALIPEIGPVASGAMAALGNSLAKGERGEEYPTAGFDYMGDAILGGATQGFLSGAGNKLLKLTGKDKASKAQTALDKAQKEYNDLMAPILGGKKLSQGEAEGLANSANTAYTSKINQAIQSGKLSGVDANAFDPNRSGAKYIVIPSEIWKNDAALDESLNATAAAADRLTKLKKINQTLTVQPKIAIPASLDEGGFNPVIQKAREFVKINDNTPINWEEAVTKVPSTTMEMVASKPIYPFNDARPKTYSQSILKALGYDKAGKGAQKASGGTAPQFDENIRIMSELPTGEEKKFIQTNYAGNPKALARDVVSQADSYVQEAYNRSVNGTLTPSKLEELAKEYASWNMSSKSDPAELNYWTRDFLAKFNQIRRNPEKTPFEYKPYTTIPSQLNQGVDVSGTKGNAPILFNEGIRPNPSIASLSSKFDTPNGFLIDFANKINKQNLGERAGENPTREAWEQALAYYGDLENPSADAVSKAISRADAEKLARVNEAYRRMTGDLQIPTAAQAQEAEANILKAKTQMNEASPNLSFSAIRDIPKTQVTKMAIPDLLSKGAGQGLVYTNTSLSDPERRTAAEAKSRETAGALDKTLSRLPINLNFLLRPYYEQAKKRGNYVNEYNIDYVLPDILRQ